MQLEARPSGRSIGKKDRSRETFTWILGAGMLVPGLAQLNWRQHERGLVFLLSFLSALVVSVFCWGTSMGWAFLAFAFVTHAASTIDLIRQRSFPVFPRFMTLRLDARISRDDGLSAARDDSDLVRISRPS